MKASVNAFWVNLGNEIKNLLRSDFKFVLVKTKFFKLKATIRMSNLRTIEL